MESKYPTHEWLATLQIPFRFGTKHYREISGDDPMSERDSDPISPEYVEHVVSESWSAGLIYMEKNSSNCLVPNIWPSNRQKRQEIQKKHLPDLETINENESEDFDFYQDLPDIMDFDEFNRIFNKDQF